MAKRVKPTLKDPSGWTVENNPHPYPYDRLLHDHEDRFGYVYKDFFEYTEDAMTVICHSCIHREMYKSGNCIDGGDYFRCTRDGHRAEAIKKFKEAQRRLNEKRTVQTTLW